TYAVLCLPSTKKLPSGSSRVPALPMSRSLPLSLVQLGSAKRPISLSAGDSLNTELPPLQGDEVSALPVAAKMLPDPSAEMPAGSQTPSPVPGDSHVERFPDRLS